ADPESSFGLLSHDLSRTPSFGAIAALIALCHGPGAVADVQAVRGVRLADGDRNRQALLLDRSDGALLVAVWLGIPGWDWPSATQFTPTERTTTLEIEGAHLSVTSHRFNDDGTINTQSLTAKAARTV